jgi:hypothetical protein
VLIGFLLVDSALSARPVYPWGVTETSPPRIALSDSSRIVASTHQLSCDLAGDAAIVNLTSGVYFGLDPVGARIWSLIREQTTFAEVREALIRLYDVEPHRLESDLRDFLSQLAEQGLVEISA